MLRVTASAVVAAVVVLGAAAVGPPIVGPADAATTPSTAGLVLNYKFDNDAGNVARDSSANSINGTYVKTMAAAARSPSVSGAGSAIKLVGTQHQFVSVPERNALDVNGFTVAALVKYTGVQNDMTFDRWEVLEKAGAYWINVRTDGHVRVGGFFGGCAVSRWQNLDSSVVIPTNTWTHVASTYDGSTLTVWINGTPAGSRAITGTTCRNNRPLAVGAKNYPVGAPEAFWDGQLDDVRIYDRALSGAEIKALLPS